MEFGFHYIFIECNICHALLAWGHLLPAFLYARDDHLRGAIVELLDVRQVRRSQPSDETMNKVDELNESWGWVGLTAVEVVGGAISAT
jgi:hypothetical protein